MRLLMAMLATLGALPAQADMVVAARTIRPQSVLTAADLRIESAAMPGTFSAIADVIGQESRVVLYPGRPILPEDIGPPALVDRNQIVPLVYAKDGLMIRLEGRALGRASTGEVVRVMNLQSRTTVSGKVQPDGSVRVE